MKTPNKSNPTVNNNPLFAAGENYEAATYRFLMALFAALPDRNMRVPPMKEINDFIARLSDAEIKGYHTIVAPEADAVLLALRADVGEWVTSPEQRRLVGKSGGSDAWTDIIVSAFANEPILRNFVGEDNPLNVVIRTMDNALTKESGLELKDIGPSLHGMYGQACTERELMNRMRYYLQNSQIVPVTEPRRKELLEAIHEYLLSDDAPTARTEAQPISRIERLAIYLADDAQGSDIDRSYHVNFGIDNDVERSAAILADLYTLREAGSEVVHRRQGDYASLMEMFAKTAARGALEILRSVAAESVSEFLFSIEGEFSEPPRRSRDYNHDSRDDDRRGRRDRRDERDDDFNERRGYRGRREEMFERLELDHESVVQLNEFIEDQERALTRFCDDQKRCIQRFSERFEFDPRDVRPRGRR